MQKAKKAPTEEEQKSPVEEQAIELDEQLVRRLWKSYLKEQGSAIERAKLDQPLRCEGGIITLTFSSNYAMEDVQKVAQPLLQHLQAELKVPRIHLQTELNEHHEAHHENKVQLYTNAEKLKHLMQKHPEVQKMVEKLRLKPN